MIRKKLFWAVSIPLTIAFIIIGVYVMAGISFVYKTNKVLKLISHLSYISRSTDLIHELERICKTTSHFDDDGHAMSSVGLRCADGGVLRPNLSASAFIVSATNQPGIREIGTEILLPRAQADTFGLTVVRDYSIHGSEIVIRLKPNSYSENAAAVAIQADADVEVKLNYRCAMPWSGCKGYRDFVGD